MLFRRQKSLPLLLGALCLLLHGCGHYRARTHPYSLNHTDLGENVAGAFQTGAVQEGEIVYEQWWKFFQDPQLGELIETALACHPTLELAKTRMSRAYDEAMIARATLLPHLFSFGEIDEERVSHFGSHFIPGFPSIFTETTIGLVSSLYELDVWQKNQALFYASLDEVHALEAEYEEAKLLLSTAIAGLYFDLQMTLEQLAITQKRLEAREELYLLLKQQFDRGIISEFRLYEIDTAVALLQDQIARLQGESEIDRHALAALVGNLECNCTPSAVAPAACFSSPFPLPASLPLDLLARRPDLTALKWRIEASALDIHAAKANFYPRIDLLGLLGLQTIHINKLLRGRAILGTAEVVGTLPIFTAGQLRAKLGVAQESLEAAIETYNETVLIAVQQVSDALTHLEKADERTLLARRAVKDGQELLELTNQKYTNGISNKLVLLNAIENVLNLEDLEIRNQKLRFEAAVELVRAIGGGYDERCPL